MILGVLFPDDVLGSELVFVEMIDVIDDLLKAQGMAPMQKGRVGKGGILGPKLTQGFQKSGVMDMSGAVEDGIVMIQQKASVSNHGSIVPLRLTVLQGFAIMGA